jgi:hypothetical protein
MRDGRLLAMDTPSELKANALPGLAWDVFVDAVANLPRTEIAAVGSTAPLLAGLDALETCPCVLRAGLAGDHLRAITPADVRAETLLERLAEVGLQNVKVEPVEPTLEDVFLALAVK